MIFMLKKQKTAELLAKQDKLTVFEQERIKAKSLAEKIKELAEQKKILEENKTAALELA